MFHRIDEDHIYTGKTIPVELEDIFKVDNHVHVQNTIIPANMFSNEEDLDYWLPMFFSTGYYNVITLPKDEANKMNQLNPYNSLNQRQSNRYGGNTNTQNSTSGTSDDDLADYDLVDVFLPMLSRERVENDIYWIDAGRALFGIYEGDDTGLYRWIEFTERSDAHTPQECKELYPSFYDKTLSIKTLAWYAREDSPVEYGNWHLQWYTPALEKATSCLHSDVAEALYRVYWLDFACASLTKSSLYFFSNHIWRQLDNGHTLRTYMSKQFKNIFEKFRTDISIKIQDSLDKRFKDSAELLVKKIGSLINKLSTRPFKNNVLAESLEKFKIEDFGQKLNANPNIIGMVNGVIEAGDKAAYFRNGKPEDFVSKSTGLIWKDLHWKHPLVMKLLNWLKRVYPNKELLDYFGKFGGSCIRGRNSDKLLVIMTGGGNNSKSMIKKAFEAAFGAYCITIPTSAITQKRSTGPDPAIARSKYAHIAFTQEPDADAPIKNGTIKEMTGGDRFFARFLNDNGGEIEPMFKFVLQCNTVPMFTSAEKSIKNRVRLMPHLSTWATNAPKNIKEQFEKRTFPLDKFFENQIPEMAPALMWYFVQMLSLIHI